MSTASSSSWDDLKMDRVLELSARRRDPVTGNRVQCKVMCFDLFATLAQLVFTDAEQNQVWSVIVYPATTSNVAEKVRAFGAGEIFRTEGGFPGVDAARRLAKDLSAALVARSARILFRALRRRAFRHRVRAHVRTKLLLGRSNIFCDLSTDLQRALSAWL